MLWLYLIYRVVHRMLFGKGGIALMAIRWTFKPVICEQSYQITDNLAIMAAIEVVSRLVTGLWIAQPYSQQNVTGQISF